MSNARLNLEYQTSANHSRDTAENSSEEEEPTNNDDHSSYSLDVEVCGIKVDALVDSFSSLTHINLDLAEQLQQLGLIGECASASVQTIDQRILENVKLCQIDVVYKGKATSVSALVVPYLIKQLVLGTDFLRQRNCEVIIDGNSLRNTENLSMPRMEAAASSINGESLTQSISAVETDHTAEDLSRSSTSPWTNLPLEITTYPASALQYTDHLFDGIIIRKRQKPQRRQFVMHREGKPAVKVTILNKELARLRCMGQEKVVEMQ